MFEGDAVREYVGGYDDWVRQRGTDAAHRPSAAKNAAGQTLPPSSAQPTTTAIGMKPKKLSYKELRELEQLPALIEQLESRQQALHAEMATADYYKQPGELIAAKSAEDRDLRERLAAAFSRWEELEARQGEPASDSPT